VTQDCRRSARALLGRPLNLAHDRENSARAPIRAAYF
jgi:hypothetical protein